MKYFRSRTLAVVFNILLYRLPLCIYTVDPVVAWG